MLPPAPAGCLTPPLSPDLDRCRTPTPPRAAPRHRADSDAAASEPASGASTPRAQEGQALSTWVIRQSAKSTPISLIERTLASSRASGTTTLYPDRPRCPPKGRKAYAALQSCILGAKTDVFASALSRLGPTRSTLGLRYEQYALIKQATARPSTFACLKLALAALPDDDVKTLMHQQSAALCGAAAAAGHIEYANWLLYAFGNGRGQYISER